MRSVVVWALVCAPSLADAIPIEEEVFYPTIFRGQFEYSITTETSKTGNALANAIIGGDDGSEPWYLNLLTMTRLRNEGESASALIDLDLSSAGSFRLDFQIAGAGEVHVTGPNGYDESFGDILSLHPYVLWLGAGDYNVTVSSTLPKEPTNWWGNESQISAVIMVPEPSTWVLVSLFCTIAMSRNPKSRRWPGWRR